MVTLRQKDAETILEQGYTTREWLDWLTRVRLLMIALILSVGVAWPSYLPLAGSSRYFLPLVIFWITLGTLHIILVRWLPKSRWHAPAQVASDVMMVSALLARKFFFFVFSSCVLPGEVLCSPAMSHFLPRRRVWRCWADLHYSH